MRTCGDAVRERLEGTGFSVSILIVLLEGIIICVNENYILSHVDSNGYAFGGLDKRMGCTLGVR